MERVAIALALAAVVVVIALVLQRRRPDAPTQPSDGYTAPAQLDRADFDRPDAPWLVAVFTSATCETCADVAAKAAVLDSSEVAVQVVEAVRDRDLHQRYAIEAVPIVAIAGRAVGRSLSASSPAARCRGRAARRVPPTGASTTPAP